MHDDEVCQLKLLNLGSFLQTSLHHTAAVLVPPDLNTVVHAGVEDELGVLTVDLTALLVVVSRVV